MKFTDYVILKEAKENKLPTNIKSSINSELNQLCHNNYYKSIPIKDIESILKKAGVTFEDDGFILTGREGRDNFNLKYNGVPVSNSMLVLTWYKMPSNNWEIVTYLS